MSVYKLWIEIDDRLLDDLVQGIVPLEIDEALLSSECLGELLSLRASANRTPAEREIHHQEKISRLPPKVICGRCQGRGWTREKKELKDTKDEDGRARSQVAVGGSLVPNPASCDEGALER